MRNDALLCRTLPLRRGLIRRPLPSLVVWLLAALLPCAARAAEDPLVEDPLVSGLGMLAEGRYAEAAETLAAIVAEKEATAGRRDASRRDPAQRQRATQAMIGAGQALRHLGRHQEALEFFEAAIEENGTKAPPDPLRLAAADCSFRCHQFDRASEYCEAVIASTEQTQLRLAAERLSIRSLAAAGRVAEAWQRFDRIVPMENVPQGEIDRGDWLPLAEEVGLAALTHNEPALATGAFRWYLEHAAAEDAPRESAVLGIAWAAAKGAEPYDVAGRWLLDFVETYPESENVPRALLVAAGCLRRSEQQDRAVEVLRRLVAEFPDADEAPSAIAQLADLDPGESLPSPAREVVRRLIDSDQPLAAGMITTALLQSAGGADPELWSTAMEALRKSPAGRSEIGKTLATLSERQQDADAERLAASVLGNVQQGGQEPAFEQAARWAAIHRRWSMLAMSAESPETARTVDQLSPVSLRLLAEGLIQTNRGQHARELLDRLIETHGVSDFDVFVRRAEMALVHDPREVARRSVQRVMTAADSVDEQTLADVLQSQLFIREARMEEARVMLERVIRQGDTADAIKARAQWLIGETYLLQRQFREAVEAYRVVETFDAAGDWTAAALVQAGKAFEQLGRPRDAAICYSGLLTRFGDSPHAAGARERLAAMGRKTELR